MAKRESVEPTQIGYVREALDIAASAGLMAYAEVTDGGNWLEIVLDGGVDAIAEVHFGGLRRCLPRPLSLQHLNDGQIQRYTLPDSYAFGDDPVAYWGAPDDLVAAGIVEPGRVQRGARWSKSGSMHHGKWHSYFAPSGRVLYALGGERFSEGRIADEAYRSSIIAGEAVGVVRIEGDNWTLWKGTKADLIDTGICQERHFPEGKRRKARGGDEDGRPGVHWWSTHAILKGHFQHRVQWAKRHPRDRPRAVAQTEPARQTASDPADFAERCETFFESMCGTIVELISGDMLKSEALRYDRTTVDKVRAALDHAGQLLQSATPVLPRAFTEREKREVAAKNDDAFRAFMQRALEKPKGRGARP